MKWEPMNLVGLYIPAVRNGDKWQTAGLTGYRSEADCLARMRAPESAILDGGDDDLL